MRTTSVRVRFASALWAGVIALALMVGSPTSASAAPVANHGQVVSAAPSGITPAVDNGVIYAINNVGDTIVAGGSFTSVTAGGQSRTRNRVFAFDANSGALSNFAPSVNGTVNAVAPGPTPGTVFIGGAFTQVNGANHNHVALLSLSTGNPVPGFQAAPTNGVVNEVVSSGGRLFVGGNFTTAAGSQHRGLVALNPQSGSVDPFMGVQFTERHNDSGSGAQGAIGVRDLDISQDGSRLVAIGNFKKADGLDRDQIAMVSLAGSNASVVADWKTDRYTPYCFSFAFDTYVRGVSFSPDGSYLVVATTGGHNTGTLCDTAARFETNASGQSLQPTWVNDSGGDTLWGVTVTETAVYVGGHQRWMNNSLASDRPGPGSVPRPGLAALNVDSGMPIKWNPGRNPRGTAVYALHATPEGLWMGSNTDWVGNYQYRRPKLAFFPLAGGQEEAPDQTADVPGTAFIGGGQAGNTNVLYRVNAGGAAVGSADSGPDWTGDADSSSPYRNSGSNAAGYSSGASSDATVPASAPNSLFDTERWSPSDNPALEWAFPVPSGVPTQVRLYFANRCSCTSTAGSREFDVSIDGQTALDDFDIVEEVGDQVGTMRAFDITSDGVVDIDFAHVTENPLINAIEIVRTDVPEPGPSASVLKSAQLTASSAAPATMVENSGVDWNSVRGAFLAGGKLFYGKNDGTFNSRSFDEGAFGAEQAIDPYHDPVWANVDHGSGGTYDGNRPGIYGQMSSVRGMAYHADRVYYTLTGSTELYWRRFNVDSGIIGSDTFTASGGRNWSDVGGMFATDDRLYFVTRSSGVLSSIPMTDNGPSGSVTAIDGPSTGGNDWRGRALFLARDQEAPPNEAPSADVESSCTELVCQFDGSGSTDGDGSVVSYEWDFGDGASGSGQSVEHPYATDGNYQVTLTVTDDDGATDEAMTTVNVTSGPPPSSDISHVASQSEADFGVSPGVQVPGSVQPGDTLLLSASVSNNTAASAPAGWSSVGSQGTSAFTTHVWTKEATAADVGNDVDVALPAARKAVVAVAAYRGVDADDPIVSSASGQSSNTATHGTPDVVAADGSWVVSIWSEKGPDTIQWNVPGSTVLRAEGYGSGGGSNSAVVADSNGPVAAGTVPGQTATTSDVRPRSVSWSIALTPQ